MMRRQQPSHEIEYYTPIPSITSNNSSSIVHLEEESVLSKVKRREQEAELELPQPFEYFEDGDSDDCEDEQGENIHRSGPLPKFACLKALLRT